MSILKKILTVESITYEPLPQALRGSAEVGSTVTSVGLCEQAPVSAYGVGWGEVGRRGREGKSIVLGLSLVMAHM